MEQQETYLTPEQVAETFHIPVSRVGNWLRQGRLKGVKLGKVWRIPQSAIDSFLATGSKTGE